MLHKTIIRVLLIILIFNSLISCNDSDSKILEQVENKTLELKVKRFDREFALSDPSDLGGLKIGYPYFFNPKIPDSIWLNKMQDSLQEEINQEVLQKFPNLDQEVTRIERFIKYLKFYYTAFKVPTIVTIAENVDYNNKVVASDTLLLISLDNYLGKNHKFYQSFPEYISEFQDVKYLLSDVSMAYAKNSTFTPLDRQLMSSMIYYGKLLYFKDVVIPFESDAVKIQYTDAQLEWAKDNESKVWEYLIDKDYLFSTQSELKERFINVAPFSKFYLELDNESAPRIGQYMGWQIVRDFMANNPKVSPAKLMTLDAKYIFKNSNYKP